MIWCAESFLVTYLMSVIISIFLKGKGEIISRALHKPRLNNVGPIEVHPHYGEPKIEKLHSAVQTLRPRDEKNVVGPKCRKLFGQGQVWARRAGLRPKNLTCAVL